MRFNNTNRSRSRGVATRKAKFSDRIPSFITPRHDRPKDQQGARNLLAGSLHCMASLLTTLLIVSLWASPSVAEDNDYPHNFVQNASCNTGTCHSAYGGGAGPDYKLGDISCLFCHDGTDPANSLPAPTVVGHSSATTSAKYGTWAMKCIDCHHEHLQAQYWIYGEESYVVSGVSDAGGITGYTLTMTGAGWEPDSLAGMVLFPNVEDLYADWSNYGIIGNTADTITVKGPMLLDGGYWDTPIGTGNKRFAVTYGKAINYIVPDEPGNGGLTQKPVRFFRSEGANSFADGDATYDGICEACHTKTSHHRNNGAAPYQSHFNGSRCTTCHPHDSGFKPVAFDHTSGGAVLAVSPCMECHDGPDPVGDVHSGQCGLCHVAPGGGGPLVEPYESTAPQGGDCIDCHGAVAAVHDADHTAAPGSGPVVLFSDDGHDDAGWVGDRPYFDVTVDCTLCHDTNLVTVHGNNCATCHPSPRNTLNMWNGDCQQCHAVYHENSTKAHEPFEDPFDAGNDCSRCHSSGWSVPQSNCLNCHATNASGDTTPPVTTANAQLVYNGPARIDFSITDNGKVGIGTTFYKLDGGPVTSGSHVLVSTAGSHALEFWSVDQTGNVESPHKIVSFEVVLDTTPPTTTSNAQAAYNQGGVITLTATDNSSQGVKTTYFRLNDGPVQTGTSVIIPATNGILTYTLTFWSEDWTGNVEMPKSVSFTVTSGTGTIRLVWGDSDTNPAHMPSGDDWADWTIRRGGWTGPVVATGSGASPNWDGVDDISVQADPTPYFVIIDWYWDGEEDQSVFSNVYVTTPGQVAVRRY